MIELFDNLRCGNLLALKFLHEICSIAKNFEVHFIIVYNVKKAEKL